MTTRLFLLGQREFIAGLRQAEPRLLPAVREANKEAAERVAVEARSKYIGLFSQHSGKHAGTIRSLASQQRAQVAIGTARVGGMLGQEFGGSSPQFRPWRGSGSDAGYFLWPTIREEVPKLEEEYLGILDDSFRAAFPE